MLEFLQTHAQTIGFGIFILVLLLLLLYMIVVHPKATCCSTRHRLYDDERDLFRDNTEHIH
jgi:hypothetical protein